MKKFHPFYVIGTFGMIFAAVLHVSLALVFSLPSVHQSFMIIYPVFLAFLIVGIGITIKNLKISGQRND